MTLLTMTLAPAGALFQDWRDRFDALRARRSAPPQPDPVREAAAVRALADRYRESDPGFASDLYAAADRYERACEEAAGR